MELSYAVYPSVEVFFVALICAEAGCPPVCCMEGNLFKMKWHYKIFFFSGSQWILSFCYACKHNCTVQATCHSPHQNDAFDPPPKKKLYAGNPSMNSFLWSCTCSIITATTKKQKKKSEFKPSLNTCCALFVHSNIHTISWPQAVTPSRLICLIHMVHTVYFHSCVFDLSAQIKYSQFDFRIFPLTPQREHLMTSPVPLTISFDISVYINTDGVWRPYEWFPGFSRVVG